MSQQIQKLSVSRTKHLELQRFVTSAFSKYKNDPSISIISPDEVFCRGNACLVGTPTSSWYEDNSHLSEESAALLAPLFTKVLTEKR